MTKEFGGVKFENAEVFEKFLKENLKRECYDLEPFYEDLIETTDANGSSDYELRSHFTKSHHPECIRFDKEYIEVSEDQYDEVITF